MIRWILGLILGLMVWVEPAGAAGVSDLQKAAAAGGAKAQYELGVRYEYGQDVDQDYTKAAEWTRKSADQGYADAQYNMGLMYEYGQGVSGSLTEAGKWYDKAAAQGMEGAIQAKGMLKRKLNPPARPRSAKTAAPEPSAGEGASSKDGRPSPFGSRGMSNRDKMRERARQADRPRPGG
jgi:TPR repeat protein